MFTRPFVQAPVRRALQSSITFGDEPITPTPAATFESWSTMDARAELLDLQAEKEQIEAELTRGLPKNMPSGEARRLRAHLSEHLQSVVQKLNGLRSEIQRRTTA
jgi:ABC-type phosphate transport system auxiliary subunit